ncbi:hypothetical protein [Vermiculatibacterium agrestimuris]|uniref:hypothetical protein n=1 Tax=Vermiculatibacterium agrestimuris TaxID=2941519 RepID=UPI00203F72D9|nr:hypothetical protein [Vermiculatibacterium agrestimuris]
MSRQEPEATQQPRPRRSRQSRRSPVMGYLVILFAVAFLLLLWAYFQQQRSNTETTDALKQSASAVQSIQDLIASNDALREENQALKEQLAQLESQLTDAKETIDAAERYADAQEAGMKAMDYFWQIDEAYVRQRYNLCRQLIQELKDVGLESFLPSTKATDNDRYSPLERYNEIYNALY